MSNACVRVGSGGVGESGSFEILTHTVAGQSSRIIKLVTTETSLCPNTGATGQIIVNDEPRVHGEISAARSTLQTEAQPNDRVAAIITSYPRFNGVQCIRLGELTVELQECDLVGAG